MELATFVSSQFILEPNELRRGINRIGLNLSESEFNALVQGNSVEMLVVLEFRFTVGSLT